MHISVDVANSGRRRGRTKKKIVEFTPRWVANRPGIHKTYFCKKCSKCSAGCPEVTNAALKKIPPKGVGMEKSSISALSGGFWSSWGCFVSPKGFPKGNGATIMRQHF